MFNENHTQEKCLLSKSPVKGLKKNTFLFIVQLKCYSVEMRAFWDIAECGFVGVY
jgi:hypothetical protein